MRLDADGRGRAARAALFLLGYLLVLLGTSVVKGMAPPAFADLVWGVTSSVTLFALTWAFLRREHRAFADLDLRADRLTVVRIAGALVGGCALYALTLGVIALTVAPLRLSAPTWPSVSQWALVLSSYLALSCMEELGFRAYALRTLVPAIGRVSAQLTIAVLFGLSHIAYGWTWSTVVMGVIPSGLLFGAAALRRGGLALAIGVHAGLNLAQWIVGEKGSAGVFTIGADAEHTARLASSAPVVATTVTLLAAAIVWWWPARVVSLDGAPSGSRALL